MSDQRKLREQLLRSGYMTRGNQPLYMPKPGSTLASLQTTQTGSPLRTRTGGAFKDGSVGGLPSQSGRGTGWEGERSINGDVAGGKKALFDRRVQAEKGAAVGQAGETRGSGRKQVQESSGSSKQSMAPSKAAEQTGSGNSSQTANQRKTLRQLEDELQELENHYHFLKGLEADDEEWEEPSSYETSAQVYKEMEALRREITHHRRLNIHENASSQPGFKPTAEWMRAQPPAAVIAPFQGNVDARKLVKGIQTGDMSGLLGRWKYLSEEQEDMLLYYAGTDQWDRATDYMELIEDGLNAQYGTDMGQRVRGIENDVLRTLATGGYGFASGVDDFAQGIAQVFSDERRPVSAMQYGSQYIREDLADSGPMVFGKSLGQWAYDGANMAGNAAPAALLTAATGGAGLSASAASALGLAADSLSDGGRGYAQALDQGRSKDQALLQGLLTGGISAGSQIAMDAVRAAKAALPEGLPPLNSVKAGDIQDALQPMGRPPFMGNSTQAAGTGQPRLALAGVADSGYNQNNMPLNSMLDSAPSKGSHSDSIVPKLADGVTFRKTIASQEEVSSRGTLSGSLKGLKSYEKDVVEDYLNAGKNVEIIPRSHKQGENTPDFYIDGVKTELKTLHGTSTNTPLTRIEDGFEQGSDVVVIDARKTEMTLEQANLVMIRAVGKYRGKLPGPVEIWTKYGILRR